MSSTSLSSYKIQFTVRDLINSVRALEDNTTFGRLSACLFFLSPSFTVILHFELRISVSVLYSLALLSVSQQRTGTDSSSSSSQPEHYSAIGVKLPVSRFIPSFHFLSLPFRRKKQETMSDFRFFQWIYTDKSRRFLSSILPSVFLLSTFLFYKIETREKLPRANEKIRIDPTREEPRAFTYFRRSFPLFSTEFFVVHLNRKSR